MKSLTFRIIFIFFTILWITLITELDNQGYHYAAIACIAIYFLLVIILELIRYIWTREDDEG